MEWYKACVGDFMALEDKLYTVKSTPDVVSHLVPDSEYCRCCKDKPCTYICPAGVYEWQDDKMIVNFENCLECGACKIACPSKTLKWEYPKGTKGITFKLG